MARHRNAVARKVAAGLALCVAAMTLQALELTAAAPAAAAPGRSAPVSEIHPKVAPVEKLTPSPSRPVAWPSAATALVTLPASARPGGVPVKLTPLAAATAQVTQARVEVLPQDAATRAARPLALRVTRADGEAGAGRARLEVDYSSFRYAYGADWAARLKLVQLPECALTTPDCAPATDLPTVNNERTGVVSADIDLAAATEGTSVRSASTQTMVVALAAGATSSTGDFTQTDLKASYAWTAGGQSGDFTWNYPVGLPPVPGGLTPDVTLGYSSGSVDGATAGANTQSSWIGEGWGYSPGFIERSHRVCKQDDGHSHVWSSTAYDADKCWRVANARISWNGHSTEIIPGADGVWRLADDDSTKVELISDTSTNITLNWHNERWKITTKDGTQYWFGQSFVPGTTTRTNSVQGERIISNDSGEPCYSSTSAAASTCAMAYRWLLDYVVDPNGNSMLFYYTKEGNNQRIAGSTTTNGGYDRSAYLNRIDYGLRAGSESTTTAPAQVFFTSLDRCDAGTCPTHTATYYKDTPWDLQCSAAPCGPATFWSSKRLSRIETKIWNGTAYTAVDKIDLAGSFPTTTNGTSPVWWLDSITHTGQATGASVEGGAITTPAVTFHGVLKLNRADYDPNGTMAAPMKYRIDRITNGTGGQIDITYSNPDTGCQFGSAFPDPDNNTKRCFPQWYQPEQAPAGWSWWHKFNVDKVVETDNVAGSPPVEHRYYYSTTGSSSGVLWHHDLAAVFGVTIAYRSWNLWRGYATVTENVGTLTGPKTQTTTLYGRGMNADRTDAGNYTRVVNTTNSLGETRADDDWLAGLRLEQTVFEGSTGAAQSRIVWDYAGTKTGERTWNISDLGGSPPTQSWRGVISKERQRTFLPVTGTWREHADVFTYDNYGQILTAEDQGDPAVSTDTICTKTSYAYNTGAYLVSYPSRVEVFNGACSATPVYPRDALTDTRMFYDNATAYTTAPAKGNLTRTDKVATFTGSTANPITTSTSGYDTFGRVTWVKDTLSRQTSTAYTQTNGLTTSVAVTNAITPVGHTTTTTLDPQRGITATATDANSKITTAHYDALGRLIKVWKPGHPTSGTPDTELGYSNNAGAAPWVSSKALGPNGNQILSYSIYDGLLRKRQIQATAPDGTRAISDTVYDEHGWVLKSSSFKDTASAPTSTPVTLADTSIDRQSRYVYDGMGRQTADELWTLNAFKWRTSTVYQGDRTAVIPPAGGTTVQDLADVRGNVVEKRQFTVAGDLSSTFDKTSYGYTLRNELNSVTDPAGNHWSYTYDLLGRKTIATDPDTGETDYTYDDAGQLTQVKDARNQILTYVYDNLGRKTEIHDGTVTGPLRASWLYDTVDKGQLTSSTRYDNGLAYISAVDSYDDGYRPESTTVTIPVSTANGALANTYTTTMFYKNSGELWKTVLPAAGDLLSEPVITTFTDPGQVATVAGLDTYVASVSYRWDGAIKQIIHGAAGKQVRHTNTWDAPTGRLLVSQVDTENQTTQGTYDDKFTTSYGYDDAGNVTVIAGKTGGTRDQVECLGYDYLGRMSKAWTEATWVCTTPQRAGAEPYWREWTFDAAGNRLTQKDKVPSGTDTDWTYHYPTAGTTKAHTLTSVDATGPLAGTATRSFTYDNVGNTLARQTDSGTSQNLTWDAEGHVSSVTTASGTTSYLYGADGSRIIERGPTKTTLYLGDTEIVLPSTGGQPTATRYYSAAGEQIGVRTASGLTWTMPDHHGTQHVQITASNLAINRNRSLPYGETRGTQVTLAGTKGFVGGTADDTGLTHLGVREYDQSIGRFISADPIMDLADPQQWNAYSYSHANPASFSDPTGMIQCGDDACTIVDPDSKAPLPSSGGGGTSGTSGSSGNNGNNGKPVVDCTGMTTDACYMWNLQLQPKPLDCRGMTPDACYAWSKQQPNRPSPGHSYAPPPRTLTPDELYEQAKKDFKKLGFHALLEMNLPGADLVGIKSFGYCVGMGASAWNSASISMCVGFDEKGVARLDVLGWGQGPSLGISAGVSVFYSSGDLDDQSGFFDTRDASIGPVGGQYAWGTGANGQDVWTATLTVSILPTEFNFGTGVLPQGTEQSFTWGKSLTRVDRLDW